MGCSLRFGVAELLATKRLCQREMKLSAVPVGLRVTPYCAKGPRLRGEPTLLPASLDMRAVRGGDDCG